MTYRFPTLIALALLVGSSLLSGCAAVNEGSAAYRFGDASSPQVLDAFENGMAHPSGPSAGTIACTQPAIAHMCVADGTSRVDMLIARVTDNTGDYYVLHFRSAQISPFPWYWPWSNDWVHDYAQQMQESLGVSAQEMPVPTDPHATLASALASLKDRGQLVKPPDKRAAEPRKDFVLLYEPEDWK